MREGGEMRGFGGRRVGVGEDEEGMIEEGGEMVGGLKFM